ncbi:MAG: MBL fold metallo-hydrolase [Thermoplasmata archaeon]|nr:MBL fold metallo-hydrolase [Thermoplasmata archaeon]
MMLIHFIEGGGFSGNIYIIDCEKPIMIDTGWDADLTFTGPQIDKALEGKKLDKIILTHRHVDHIGGALVIQEKFGGTMYAQKMEAEALRAGDNISTGGRTFGTKVVPMDVNDLEDNEIIDLEGGQILKVMVTPGHTIGSICLLSDDGNLFSGDTVFTQGGVGRWDFPTGDYDMLLESIERLAELSVKSLYPGHGMPAENIGLEHIRLGLRYLKEMGRHG